MCFLSVLFLPWHLYMSSKKEQKEKENQLTLYVFLQKFKKLNLVYFFDIKYIQIYLSIILSLK